MINLAVTDTIAGVAGTATAVTYSIFGMEFTSTGPTENYKKIAQGQLGTSAGALYTVTAPVTSAFVEEIVLVNATALPVAGVALYSGGTAAANLISSSIPLLANGMHVRNRSGHKTYDGNGALLTAVTPSGLQASLTAATAGINSTETSVLALTIPANYVTTAGKTFWIMGSGVCTSSAANASNFRARIGTAGTSADNAAGVVTPTAAASGTAIPFLVELYVTLRSAGSSGAAIGSGSLKNNGVTGVSAAAVVVGQTTATVTVNTTVQNILQLSYVAAASTTTCTFHEAIIQEVVK